MWVVQVPLKAQEEWSVPVHFVKRAMADIEKNFASRFREEVDFNKTVCVDNVWMFIVFNLRKNGDGRIEAFVKTARKVNRKTWAGD